MPFYVYECKRCLKKAEVAIGRELTFDERGEVCFETRHAMEPTPAELKEAKRCPTCSSTNTYKVYRDMHVSGYVRGAGFINDRAGCRRDMNLFHLTGKDQETGQTLDPYAGMREAGEVDEIAAKIKRAGRRGNPKHYTTSSGREQRSLEKAVREASKIKVPDAPSG